MTELRKTATETRSHRVRPSIQAALDRGDIEGVIDNLTELQKRFCEEYLIDFNGSKAVVRAGYNTKYPNRMASQLLLNPGVKACIDQISMRRAGQHTLKPEYVVNKITKTIERAELDGNHGAVLRGCELLAKHLGMFIERTEISGPNGDAIKYQQIQEAADAFTSAINGLIERGRSEEAFIVSESRNEGGA